ncbi:MAG: 23S rRNA (adenine(2030)-N(6))-methyltransferase RlmJ, partial [Pseudomonadota bacterium]
MASAGGLGGVMLSYQHAYHAGSPADLHKHVALAVLLAPLAGRGALYVESHAGRGLYDLSSAEAGKTGEAAAGLGTLAAASPDGPPEGPFWDVLLALRGRDGPSAYPGSPAVAASLLGAADRISLHERHPAELEALRRGRAALDAFGRGRAGPAVEVIGADGHAALRTLRPGAQRGTRAGVRRGLALIDPSYEVKSEYKDAADTVVALTRSWPQGIIMLWYPILPAARHNAMVEAVASVLGSNALRHEALYRNPPERGMTGSGLLIVGITAQAAEALLRA